MYRAESENIMAQFTTKTEVKAEYQRLYDEAMERAGVFWAFSKEQFEENKTPKADDEKYVSIGLGGYMPKSKLERFKLDVRAANAWKKFATKRLNPEEREAEILYELNNYEAFYTGDIRDAYDALKDWYTLEEVEAVYKKNFSVASMA